MTCQAEASEISAEISAEPPLPAANLVQDSGFEHKTGKDCFWSQAWYYAGSGEAAIVSDCAHSGKMALRFAGFSKDARGQAVSKEFHVQTGIPYSLDFWARADRELPQGGLVQIQYIPENKDIIGDTAEAVIPQLVKIPGKWSQFSNPPSEMPCKKIIIFWQPRGKDKSRFYRVINDNIITFDKDLFGGAEQIKVKLYLQAASQGIIYFDDISLIPQKTMLKYKVSGKDISEITLSDGKDKIIESKKFREFPAAEYASGLLVPANNSYKITIKTKNGEVLNEFYPKK